MREQFAATIIGRNEPEAFGVVEPFDNTGRHLESP
jgi:hypothetical protein